MKPHAAFLFLVFGFAAPAVADDLLKLGVPAGCTVGETCWIINYPDTTTAPPARDFRCGPRTYSNHNGTDFAVADRHAMEAGVPVLAAASGVVDSVRDGEFDGAYLELGLDAVARKECGNGVVLKHEGRWRTQYCHLRRDSVAVKPGQKVKSGQTLGLVGLSGRSEFPHLHLAVRRYGLPVDPFTAQTLGGGCGKDGGKPLWLSATGVDYRETAVYAVGVASRVPRADEIKADVSLPGARASGKTDLVGWGAAFGFAPGMRFLVELAAPDGTVLARHEDAADHPQAWRFSAAGRRLPKNGWAPGTYRVTATMSRDGEVLSRKTASFEMK